MRLLFLAATAFALSSPAYAQTIFLDDATVVKKNGAQAKTDIIIEDGVIQRRGTKRRL